MDILFPQCAGLDVHKRTVVACTLTSAGRAAPQRATATFGTMTADLLALGDWLAQHGVTHVVMGSTGEFWKPIYNLLEASFHVWVINAQHIFIPPLAQRDLRDLTRERTNLVQERASVIRRLHKVLEWANLKLTAVVTDVTGVSARAMLAAILDGEEDSVVLAELARGRLRTKRAALEQVLSS